MIFPNFEDTSKTRENGVFREEKGDSRRVGKIRFSMLRSVAKNGKKERKKYPFYFFKCQFKSCSFHSNFLKKQELLNPNNVKIACHFHAKQIFILFSLEKSVGNNL